MFKYVFKISFIFIFIKQKLLKQAFKLGKGIKSAATSHALVDFHLTDRHLPNYKAEVVQLPNDVKAKMCFVYNRFLRVWQAQVEHSEQCCWYLPPHHA